MPCETVILPGGQRAIVCGSRQRHRCAACGRPAALQCDWKAPTRKSGTCDRYICATCSTKPAADKDLCPDHARAWEAWKASRPRP